MDKSSFFFTANCGVCHPGGGAMQHDRNGNLYFDKSTNLFGYLNGVSALLSTTPPSGPQLDGDYGFINPSTGVPGVANWSKTGVSEPDCLMCHMTQNATGPGTASHNNGLSWHKRAATLRGTGVAGVANFEWAPTAGAGWASVSYVAGQSPPMASAVTIDYNLGLAAGTLVDQGGNLTIPLGKVGAVKETNCRGCHATPDGKKSGRTLLPTTDAHTAKGVSCTRCHTTPNSGAVDSMGVAMANPHQIGKGNITIGSVRNDLDNTVKSCTNCHLEGGDAAAPNPNLAHNNKVPSDHMGFLNCQACHIRHLDDDGFATPSQDIPEIMLDMTSNGTQNSSLANAYLGTDPIDPSQNLPELSGKPFRWYPGLRWWSGKITTVKPLYSSWFGEWVSGTGNSAVIKPIPLRLVRKALTDAYAPGSPRLASLTLTPGSKVATGAPVLHKKDEIKNFLVKMRNAVDTANTDTSANDIATNPVLVKADKVYYLNALDEVEYFESTVAESHDFAVNHNVVAKRDPLNTVLTPGPYGAGGCTDCHGPNSSFFYGKQLAEPAQYDFLDEHGTVPNPDVGKPAYHNHYEVLGLTKLGTDIITATAVPARVDVTGTTGMVVYGEIGNPVSECRASDGGCMTGITPGADVTFTAVPDTGKTFLGWSGCTPSDTDPLVCTANVGTPSSGVNNSGIRVTAKFGYPTVTHPITASVTGDGTITPAGVTEVQEGNHQTYLIAPAAGNRIDKVVVDGVNKGAITSYTFITVTEPHTISISFVPDAYTITASINGGNGTISPAGATSVATGGSQTYDITPAAGYRVSYVLVNWSDKGALTSYTFENVQANQTIAVAFTPITYAITVAQGANGTISPYTSSNISQGTNKTYSITPATGYHVETLTVDGLPVAPANSYTFTNIQANHSITAAFAANPSYTISANAGTGGSISPAGDTLVQAGLSKTYTIIPDAGQRVAKVLVDGVNKGAITSYYFYKVASGHTIVASFVPDTYTITATVTGSGGSITPSGTITVNGGASQSYDIAPAAGYKISYVLVNGVNKGAVASYTFTNVRANQTIKVGFVPVL